MKKNNSNDILCTVIVAAASHTQVLIYIGIEAKKMFHFLCFILGKDMMGPRNYMNKAIITMK